MKKNNQPKTTTELKGKRKKEPNYFREKEGR